MVWSLIQETFPPSLFFDSNAKQTKNKSSFLIYGRVSWPLRIPWPLPFYLMGDMSLVYANAHCYTHFCSAVPLLSSLSAADADRCQMLIWFVWAHVIQ